MTIEEAIKRCEEVAEREQQKGYYANTEANQSTEYGTKCYECAQEHRQLAEWLKELKALRDFANFVAESVTEAEFEENSGFYAEVYCRKLHKMGFIETEDDKWIFNNKESEE